MNNSSFVASRVGINVACVTLGLGIGVMGHIQGTVAYHISMLGSQCLKGRTIKASVLGATIDLCKNLDNARPVIGAALLLLGVGLVCVPFTPRIQRRLDQWLTASVTQTVDDWSN